MAGLFDELRVLLHGIWNRRWIALAVAWGVAMLGWLGVALIPNSYQSKARVYVNTQSLLEDRMGITQVQSQQDLDRLRSTLASAENLEKVVRVKGKDSVRSQVRGDQPSKSSRGGGWPRKAVGLADAP